MFTRHIAEGDTLPISRSWWWTLSAPARRYPALTTAVLIVVALVVSLFAFGLILHETGQLTENGVVNGFYENLHMKVEGILAGWRWTRPV